MVTDFKGRIIFSDNYKHTIDKIKLINRSLNSSVSITKSLNEDINLNVDSDIRVLENYNIISKINSNNLNQPFLLAAYDESILELNTLEGKVRCISHCSLIQNEEKYIPAAYVTLKFYTKSSRITGKSTEFSDFILTDDVTLAQTKEYVQEREYFLSQAAPENSYIFIDGPMFSGAATSGNFQLIEKLMTKNCMPIFFVKNSDSTIITERFQFAKGYNSDLHWAYSTLNAGEISQIFAYTSKEGRQKAMCFMKIYEKKSPVRIEFPLQLFESNVYGSEVFDMIYYQYLANGSQNNIQTRIIQVTEMYAREVLKSTNLYNEIDRMGLIKTMNEERDFI